MKEEYKNILQKLVHILRPYSKFIYDKDGNKIGLVGKINLEDSENVEKLIKKINKFKEKDTEYLIVENLSFFNREEIYIIENETNLRILDGINIKSYFFPIALKELHAILDNNLEGKEILFFCGDKNITEEFILAVCKEAKFITLVGNNEEIIEDISKSIFESTGLSIFHCKNINKILKNYSIIINLNENVEVDINKIRKEAIVFNFSFGKKSQVYGIVDFTFKTDGLNIKDNSYIGESITSDLYEYFNKVIAKDLKGVIVENQEYSPKKFIDVKIRQSRGL